MSSIPIVFSSVYSGVHVYEMNCRSVAVMRRRDDSFLNATQILKVAGVDKGRRTKILEREVQVGEHEKVQGGYGKYQGTWIPFDRGVEIARQYGVEELLRPLFEYIPNPEDEVDTPKKRRLPPPRPSRPSASLNNSNDFDEIPRLAPRRGDSLMNSSQMFLMQSQQQPLAQHKPPANNSERYRAILMSVFLNHENHKIPELLTNSSSPPSDLDIDIVIDDQGHTSLHWAAALSRISILKLLMNLRADPRRVNFNGESALIRAVLVTNNFDNDTFYELLTILNTAIDIADKKGRTLFHHIALTAGIKGRVQASRYYLDVLLDMMKKHNLDVTAMIDKQDKNGDTALNIAARIGNYGLVEQLLIAGANTDIPNRAGLRPIDFGIEDTRLAALFQAKQSGSLNAESSDESVKNPSSIPAFGLERSAAYKRYSNTVKGREMAGEFESIVASMESDIATKEAQLQEALSQIRTISEELGSARRVIQQLLNRISGAQHRCKAYEVQLGIRSDSSSKDVDENDQITKLELEVLRLKNLLVAHNVPADEYTPEEFASHNGDVSPTTAADVESKAQQLIAKVLNVTSAAPLIDPLLAALNSERNLDAMDRDVSSISPNFNADADSDADDMEINED